MSFARRGEVPKMLTLLSPAKTLDFESKLSTRKSSQPRWMVESSELVDLMRSRTPEELEAMMKISPELGLLNYERFQDWSLAVDRNNSRPAILAFMGDVYRGLDVASFTERDFTFAQKNLRILSGLHGILRPLDLIQPYRLEMGSKLPNSRGKDLYAFWSKTVTSALNDDLDARSPRVVVDLASKEYGRAVHHPDLVGEVITPVFKDFSRGEYRIMGFFAKRARGLMARWMVRARIKSMKSLRDFSEEGYRYSPEHSNASVPTFVRAH